MAVPRLKKILVNGYEEATDTRLRAVCDRLDARVFAKVRVADVLNTEGSGIDGRAYTFALKSHFDFVVAGSDHVPLFAVEFDGAQHRSDERQRERDTLKDGLCKRFKLPLLRINAKYLRPRRRRMDMLTWLVEVWFMQRGFEDAQEEGTIPLDEGFSPAFVSRTDYPDDAFPFWWSADVLDEIRKLHAAGRCAQMSPSVIVGQDAAGDLRALAYIRVARDAWVVAETGMRRQHFPVPLEELLEDLVLLQLHQSLKKALRGGPSVARTSVDQRSRSLRERVHILSAHLCSDSKNVMAPDEQTGDLVFNFDVE